ncbi:MAG: ABC transporter substrate-binding protein [Pseudomonadota bacterium]
MKRMFFYTAIMGIFMVSLGLHTGDAYAAGRGVTDDTIKMGMILVKTGPVAALGNSHSQGIKDYFRYVNESGGIHGRKIEWVHEDDQFKADLSLAAFKKLSMRDKVLSIITCGGTPQMVANMANIEKYKANSIPNSLAEEMYIPHKPYIFNVGASYEEQIYIIMDYIFDDLKVADPKIGFVYAETEFGKACLSGIRKRCKEYNIKTAEEVVLPMGSVDASSQVLSLQKSGADIVVFSCLIPDTVTFLKAAQKYNYNPTIFAINWATDDIIIKLAGPAAGNLIGVNFLGAWQDDSPGMKLARELVQKYESKVPLTSVYTFGFATSMLYVEAFKRAGKNLTPDTLKKAFETFREVSTNGVTSPITWKKGDHSPPNLAKFYKADVDKVKFIAITDWRKAKKVK